MAKKQIKLSEAQLRDMIAENVNKVLSELDWKTYANAAKKRYQQYKDNPENKESWDKYWELNKNANEKFGDEYVGLMKYNTLGDKLKGKHSPTFDARFNVRTTDRMPYGAVQGYNRNGDKLFSTQKGSYFGPNGYTTPGKFFKDKEVGDAFKKADDELWDYHNGNYEYVKGKGWQLKENKIAKIVAESVKKFLKEYEDFNQEETIGDELQQIKDAVTTIRQKMGTGGLAGLGYDPTVDSFFEGKINEIEEAVDALLNNDWY